MGSLFKVDIRLIVCGNKDPSRGTMCAGCRGGLAQCNNGSHPVQLSKCAVHGLDPGDRFFCCLLGAFPYFIHFSFHTKYRVTLFKNNGLNVLARPARRSSCQVQRASCPALRVFSLSWVSPLKQWSCWTNMRNEATWRVRACQAVWAPNCVLCDESTKQYTIRASVPSSVGCDSRAHAA